MRKNVIYVRSFMIKTPVPQKSQKIWTLNPLVDVRCEDCKYAWKTLSQIS